MRRVDRAGFSIVRLAWVVGSSLAIDCLSGLLYSVNILSCPTGFLTFVLGVVGYVRTLLGYSSLSYRLCCYSFFVAVFSTSSLGDYSSYDRTGVVTLIWS